MLTTIFLLVLYVAVITGVAAAARGIGRSIPIWYLAVFAILPAFFLFPCFFGSRTPIPIDHVLQIPPWSSLASVPRYDPNLNDPTQEMVPWAKAVRVAWKEGSLPLRDRWNGCGTPLAANSQSAAFSPLTFLMMLLPLARAETLAVAVKLFLALCGMWLWLAELGVSRDASVFGAVSFGFSCTMTPWLLFPHTSVICLWPWGLFCFELLQDERLRARAFWALVAVFLLWHLGGHPESAALGGCFLALWWVVRTVSRTYRSPLAAATRVCLGAGAAAALSAFLLLPEVAAIQASNRLATAGQFWSLVSWTWRPHGPLWPSVIFTPFFPRSLGDGVKSPMIAGGAGSYFEMSLAYFGIAGWSLVLSILRPGAPRRREEAALFALLLVGFTASIALWPTFELVHLLPGVALGPPLRLFSWVALAGSAIAAFEIDRLRSDLARRPAGAVGSLLVILVVLAGFGVFTYFHFRSLHAATGGLASQRNALKLALLALLGTGAVAVIAAWKPKMIALAPLLLAAVSGAELFDQGRRLYQFGDPAFLFPETPLIAFLQTRPRPFRVVGEEAALFPSTNVFAGLEDVRTYDPMERRDYILFLDQRCGYDPSRAIRFLRDVNCPALDLLNVRYLVSASERRPPDAKWRPVYRGGDGTVFENASALPRVFAPEGPPEAHRQSARVRLTDYAEETNEASFRAYVLPGGGDVLVLASLVQDGGWTATDERGVQIPTERPWGPFLGLRLKAGDHTVRLRYRSPGSRLGGAISVATAAVLAGAAILGRRKASVPGTEDESK